MCIRDRLKLCESDNLGIRYLMIGLYTVLEKFDKAEELYNKYSYDSSFMLFPLSIMYYKKGCLLYTSYANILMPCIANIGNLGYVLVAVIGGILSVNGILTIGSIAAFLQYVKAFTNPLGQVSQQMNSIIMALAGAERIFELLDEEPEQDLSLIHILKNMGIEQLFLTVLEKMKIRQLQILLLQQRLDK